MSFFKTRKGAATVFAAAIVLSVILGSGRSLNALRKNTEAAFYNGVDNDGFSIQELLANRCTQALNMTTVAKRYINPTDSVITNVSKAVSALQQENSIHKKYTYDRDLDEYMTALYTELGNIDGMTESDEKYRQKLYINFTSQGQEMSHNQYNQIVDEFNNNVLSRFPANILCKVTFCGAPEAFR